ncbi:hypothetical protein L1987_18944 [Smallanthus sonchifolius]|uniref:Uncharacterized protein n=1 Tax=Smallanthus sonchifolius TaxID=185202 RepID=A0ACB9J377_9ASTR|nr:hypothetical protein L1987_18944 [Smallanthus sonchifolius]
MHQNAGDYHDRIKYLKHSKVYFALTIDPVIYESYIRRFWSSAVVSEVDGVKNHSKSTFSGRETPLFPELMGFFDVKSGAESRSSSSSSYDGHEYDGHEADGDNVDDNDVLFETEHLNTTQDTPPISPNHDRIPTPIHKSHKAVAELTTLVSSLPTTVQSQDKEILKLKKENKSLKLAKSSSKPRKFKRLVRGPHPQPSYKYLVVSSSTSSEDDAVRRREKVSSDDEIFYDMFADVGPSSPLSDKVEADCASGGPMSPVGENIVSSSASPIQTIDKGKQIASEAEP